jgi:hypothetical protein
MPIYGRSSSRRKLLLNEKLPFSMRLQKVGLVFVKISMENKFWKFAVPKVFSSWKCQPFVLKGNQIFHSEQEEKCF